MSEILGKPSGYPDTCPPHLLSQLVGLQVRLTVSAQTASRDHGRLLLVATLSGLSVSQDQPEASGRLSAKTNGPSWQTVSQDQRSQLADCQPRPTVPAGRLSAKTNNPSWQTVSQDQRSQLADCEPRPTVPAGRLSAGINSLSWQTIIWDQRSQLGLTVSAGRRSATTNGLSWQTVSWDQRSQLGPTVSAGR
ncbi:hypothetical protein PCASD_26504, partial [Puccinia coronata f. sp. avenae]